MNDAIAAILAEILGGPAPQPDPMPDGLYKAMRDTPGIGDYIRDEENRTTEAAVNSLIKAYAKTPTEALSQLQNHWLSIKADEEGVNKNLLAKKKLILRALNLILTLLTDAKALDADMTAHNNKVACQCVDCVGRRAAAAQPGDSLDDAVKSASEQLRTADGPPTEADDGQPDGKAAPDPGEGVEPTVDGGGLAQGPTDADQRS